MFRRSIITSDRLRHYNLNHCICLCGYLHQFSFRNYEINRIDAALLSNRETAH